MKLNLQFQKIRAQDVVKGDVVLIQGTITQALEVIKSGWYYSEKLDTESFVIRFDGGPHNVLISRDGQDLLNVAKFN